MRRCDKVGTARMDRSSGQHDMRYILVLPIFYESFGSSCSVSHLDGRTRVMCTQESGKSDLEGTGVVSESRCDLEDLLEGLSEDSAEGIPEDLVDWEEGSLQASRTFAHSSRVLCSRL